MVHQSKRSVQRTPDNPCKRMIRSIVSNDSPKLAIAFVLLSSILYRFAIGLGSYSGKGKPPMYGDFEAQRHWLELTQHLPVSEWYFYDLQYWGLDYPPLTAFHSWLCGAIGSAFNNTWFALETSRGMEKDGLVSFMRHSVVISEYLTYVPAILAFASLVPTTTLDRTTSSLLILLQPSLLLIDHGHFQYNTVMLGLLIYALYFLSRGQIYLGAVCYVFCLSFKQMGLYYAPAIFAYLLATTIKDFPRLIVLSLVTAASFLTCYGPFYLFGGQNGIAQVFIRMFPFGRGLFEDKVANFWCALNVLYKLRIHFDNAALQKFSLILTLISILPACIVLFLWPSGRNLLLSTASCAWGFFLFSFQVHEKSVLLPLVPSSLLLLYQHQDRSWIGYINIVAVFSLWPLLKKDGLVLQYFVFTTFWIWFGGFWRLKTGSSLSSRAVQLFQGSTYLAILILHIFEPIIYLDGKPDLPVVLNVLLCAPAFGTFYLWTIQQLLL